MTSKELIQKLDAHMRVNKITRKSVADKLGVTSSAVGRILSADNCGLREFISLLDAAGTLWLKSRSVYFKDECKLHEKNITYEMVVVLLEARIKINADIKVKRMLASENMKLSTFLKLTEAAGVTNDYFKFD